MGIEAKRREKLKKMSERDRLKAEEEYKKEEQKRKAHELPHPVSEVFVFSVVGTKLRCLLRSSFSSFHQCETTLDSPNVVT